MFDGELLELLALGALSRANQGVASIAHIASVLSSLANCNMVWVEAALTEHLFMGMSEGVLQCVAVCCSVLQCGLRRR